MVAHRCRIAPGNATQSAEGKDNAPPGVGPLFDHAFFGVFGLGFFCYTFGFMDKRFYTMRFAAPTIFQKPCLIENQDYVTGRFGSTRNKETS